MTCPHGVLECADQTAHLPQLSHTALDCFSQRRAEGGGVVQVVLHVDKNSSPAYRRAVQEIAARFTRVYLVTHVVPANWGGGLLSHALGALCLILVLGHLPVLHQPMRCMRADPPLPSMLTDSIAVSMLRVHLWMDLMPADPSTSAMQREAPGGCVHAHISCSQCTTSCHACCLSSSSPELLLQA